MMSKNRGWAFDEVVRDASGRRIAHPQAVLHNRRLPRDQAPSTGNVLSGEAALMCIREIVKRTDPDEVADLLAAMHELVDKGAEEAAQDQPPEFNGSAPAASGTDVEQPPLFKYGTMPMSQFAQDRALGQLPPPPSPADQRAFYEMFPEARRIRHI